MGVAESRPHFSIYHGIMGPMGIPNTYEHNGALKYAKHRHTVTPRSNAVIKKIIKYIAYIKYSHYVKHYQHVEQTPDLFHHYCKHVENN
jgi:hypothetical protein